MGKIKPEDYTVGKRICEICKEAGKKKKKNDKAQNPNLNKTFEKRICNDRKTIKLDCRMLIRNDTCHNSSLINFYNYRPKSSSRLSSYVHKKTNLNTANFFRCLKLTRIARGGSRLIKNWCLKIKWETNQMPTYGPLINNCCGIRDKSRFS